MQEYFAHIRREKSDEKSSRRMMERIIESMDFRHILCIVNYTA